MPTGKTNGQTGLPWWSLRGEARTRAKSQADHSADDAMVLAMFPRMKRVKRSLPKPETIDKYRERLFRMADEIEQTLRTGSAGKTMATIQGRNGRTYQDGKRVETVTHPETRTPAEVRRARATVQPRQPSGEPSPDLDKFQVAWAADCSRHNTLWPDSYEGRRRKAYYDNESEKLRASREQKQQAEKFAESVRPAVEHAQRTLATAQADSSITVAELETLTANVELARQGKLDEYRQADQDWRAKQSSKIVAAAVEVDSQARTLASQRDELLKAAYEPLKESVEPVYGDVYYPPDYAPDPSKAGKTIREVIVP
jgi:hypothetical protein